MPITLAQGYALQINGARMLDYARTLRRAKEIAVLIVEDRDKETYQFWFCDDSKLNVDQVTCRATALTERN